MNNDAVQSLAATSQAADRLAASALAALSTFYEANAKPVGQFRRDSLKATDEAPPHLSVGGLGVCAALWDLDSLLAYLATSSAIEPHWSALKVQRDAVTKGIAELGGSLPLSKAFGQDDALSTSRAAFVLGHHRSSTPHIEKLWLRVKGALEAGWPTLPNVEHQHPYVAASVFRAASAPHLQELGQDLGPGLKHYRERAVDYLWRQHGLAYAGGAGASTRVLEYDPVGACWALELLTRDPLQGTGRQGDLVRVIASNAELIASSTKHILDGASGTGALPWGVPFSYQASGQGAFATSVSGIAALTAALYRIFFASRRLDYPGSVESLLRTIHALPSVHEVLFRLPSTLEASRVQLDGQGLTGWCTDRAASTTRVESWVTADVLSLATHLGLLCREIAQFLVIKKYSGARVTSAPQWPYEPPKLQPAPAPSSGSIFQDPDVREDGEPDLRSPIHALHQALSHYMTPDEPPAWKSDLSSVLLFGPPGTAKTTLAESIAARLRWQFVQLSPSNFVEDGLELIERRTQTVFGELSALRECVILFDEVDSLLMDREHLLDGNMLSFTVPALLPKMQALTKLGKRQRLLVIIATNFFDRLDPAMVRRGRVDERLLVLPYNCPARESMLQRDGNLDPEAAKQLAKSSPLLTYEELKSAAARHRDGVSAASSGGGIAPSLYASRVGRVAELKRVTNSYLRLAIEVAEVVGRLLEEGRNLDADSPLSSVQARLGYLVGALANHVEHAEWRQLCENLLNVNKSTAPQPRSAGA